MQNKLNGPQFRIRLRGQEQEDPPRLLDVYTFLHDFNLLYEISRAATDPNYEYFEFSRLVFDREDGLFAALSDDDRLRVEKLSKESPFELVTLLAAAPIAIGSIWGVVQIFEKVINFRLNRKKLKEELKKLQRENSSDEEPFPTVDDSEGSLFLFENPRLLERRLHNRGAAEFYQIVGDRLKNAKIEIVDMEIGLFWPPPAAEGPSAAPPVRRVRRYKA